MLKPALLTLLCILASCSSDRTEDPQSAGDSEVEGTPSQPSTALPPDQTAPAVSPNPTAEETTADSNTTLPAPTPEEAAPPPEP